MGVSQSSFDFGVLRVLQIFPLSQYNLAPLGNCMDKKLAPLGNYMDNTGTLETVTVTRVSNGWQEVV